MKARCRCTSLLLRLAMAILAPMPVWADGELDTGFGTNGVVRIEFPNSSHGYLRDVAVVNGELEAAGFEREFETGGSFIQGCSTPYPDIFIVRLSLSGEVIGSPISAPQQALQ